MVSNVPPLSQQDEDEGSGDGDDDEEMDVDATSEVSFTDSNPEEYPLDPGAPVDGVRVIKKVVFLPS